MASIPQAGQANNLQKTGLNKKKIIAAICVVIIIILSFWMYTRSNGPTIVKAVPVSRGDIDILVSAPAKVSLPSRADLNFKTGGKISKIYAKKGDKVTTGDVLAELDMKSVYPPINSAQAGLKSARASLEKLLSGKTRRELAPSEIAVQSAAIAIKSAQKSLVTAKKIVVQSKKKTTLGINSAEVGINTATQGLSKAKNPHRTEEKDLAEIDKDKALLAYNYAQDAYQRQRISNNETLSDAKHKVDSAEESYNFYNTQYTDAKAAYDASSTATNKTVMDAAHASYLGAKSAFDGAKDANNSVSLANDQSLKASENQVDLAEKAYSAAIANYNLSMASARTEDVAIAEDQLQTAQINLQMAQMGNDDPTLDQTIDGAQSALDTAIQSSKTAIAQLELQKEGPRAADLRAAEAQIEAAKAQLQTAQNTADDQVLVAPFSGVVASVNGKKGEMAGVASAGGAGSFITLLSFDRIELTADVDETDVGKLKAGQDINITLDAYDGIVFKGKLTNISLLSAKNATGGTIFEVTIVVNPAKQEFREGMTGDVDIVIASRKATLTVPFEAVKMEGNKSSVFVVEKDIAKLRKIVTGLSSDVSYEVKSGLSMGDSVIIGKTDIKDGQSVTADKSGRIGQ